VKRFIVTSILFASAAFGLQQGLAQEDVQFDTGSLEIISQDLTHAFEIEIADTPAETARGLMFRESLAPDHGMLFDFGEPREPAMWMKNTLIPLDMLFLDVDGNVVAIAQNTQPHSLRRISPGMPVKAVLELNGGTTRELNILPGSVVVHDIFENTEE
jgi:uncharacterized membrane protein (UPF0127 family)